MQSKNLTQTYIQQIEESLSTRKMTAKNVALLSTTLADFKKVGLPTHKGEAWRYSKVQNYLPKRLATHENIKFDLEIDYLKETYILAICGNRVILDHSKLPTQNFDVKINSLDQNFNFNSLQYDKEDALDSLSLMNTEEVISINIQNGLILDKPLQIIYFSTLNSEEVLFTPRITIDLSQKSECEIIEYFPKGYSQYNSNLAIECRKDSKLTHCKLNFTKELHVGKLSVIQEESSSLNSFIFSSGSKLSRTQIKTCLNGKYAKAEINGLYALADETHSDQFIEINHNAAETTSYQLFKGILADSSHGVFTGKVIIKKDAQLVNANQLNKNLLLSKKCKVDTRPSLQVEADDVKCTHGATTGQLNEEQLFYLISRGIKKDVAYSLLIHGFMDDALEKINNQRVRTLIENKILREFKKKIIL